MNRRKVETLAAAPRSVIRAVQYGVVSPEDVAAQSEVPVNSTVIYKTGIAYQNGINDPHMGPSNGNMLCMTCFNTLNECSGHFGHIELAMPIINVTFLQEVWKLLNSCCFYCSRILLRTDDPRRENLRKCKSHRESIKLVFKCCRKIMQCPFCEGQQPTYILDDIIIRAIFTLTPKEAKEIQNNLRPPPLFTPRKMLQILRHIPLLDLDALGVNINHSRPGSMIWQKLLVPPTVIRPSRCKANNKKIGAEDDLTIQLRKAVKRNLQLLAILKKSKGKLAQEPQLGKYQILGGWDGDKEEEEEPTITIPTTTTTEEDSDIESKKNTKKKKKKKKPSKVAPPGTLMFQSLDDLLTGEIKENIKLSTPKRAQPVAQESLMTVYVHLQRVVAGYQNHKYQRRSIEASSSDYTRDKKSLRSRITGDTAKQSRLRNLICGKRQNESCRTVITPSQQVDIDEVGVPKAFCQVLTFEDIVTRFNIHKLLECVRRGPDGLNGANFIQRANATKQINLRFVDRFVLELHYGDTVLRHLQRGDALLMNRQPTLHRMSFLAHRVVPTDVSTFQLNEAVTNGYAADFDGDEMNGMNPRSSVTRAEAENMSVKANMMKDGAPVPKFTQHCVVSLYLLTDPNAPDLRWETACQLVMQNQYVDLTRWMFLANEYWEEQKTSVPFAPSAIVPAVMLLNVCLPPTLFLNFGSIRIRDGKLITGQLDKKSMNSGVLARIWFDFGPDIACEFLSGSQRIFEAYLRRRGLSIGLYDFWNKRSPEEEALIQRALDFADQPVRCNHKPGRVGTLAEYIHEENVSAMMDKIRDIVGFNAVQKMRARSHRNGLLELVDSLAKGTDSNLVQILAMIGQQRNHESRRMPHASSHFNADDFRPQKTRRAEAAGMIISNFGQGMNPLQYFAHAAAARNGLVGSAVRTRDAGYTQRKLTKANEDLSTRFDLTVREKKKIIQFLYGHDGFDSTALQKNDIRIVQMQPKDIQQRYGTLPASELPVSTHFQNRNRAPFSLQPEVARLLQLRRRVIESANIQGLITSCMFPISFQHVQNRVFFRHHQARKNTKSTNTTQDPEHVRLTPLEIQTTVNGFWQKCVEKYVIRPTLLVTLLFFDWCSTTTLFARQVTLSSLREYLGYIHESLLRRTVAGHENVGDIAAQHCTEPMTQMTLHSPQMTNDPLPKPNFLDPTPNFPPLNKNNKIYWTHFNKYQIKLNSKNSPCLFDKRKDHKFEFHDV